MRRQGQHSDSGINPMVAAQMLQMSAQQMQHNPASSHFTGRGTDTSRTLYEGQMSDSKLGMEMQVNKDPRTQVHQDELEARFENITLPQTFEGLQQKFLNDIMNLTKEQEEAEDRENARHRERLNAINAQYQEKLLAVRARQATHREEFLHKESQARHQQYQQVTVSSYQNNTGVSEAYGFDSTANAVSPFGDAHHGYAADRYDSYAERSGFGGGARGRGLGGRDQYPGGRAYNSRGRYF